MRTNVMSWMMVAIAAVQVSGDLQACGDKFLLVGRGAKFRQAYAAIHPATIVLYAKPQSGAAKAIRDPRFRTDLKAAGHRVTYAEDERALSHALEEDRVDLVLTDVADIERIAKQAVDSPSRPNVLPVMAEPSKEEAKAIESRYHCRLTVNDRLDHYLAAIDDAMKARIDQRKK